MKTKIKIEAEIEVKTLCVSAGVRYWEDGIVNGVTDDNGDLIPCRNGNSWEPKIDIDTGRILNWLSGTVADVHYKVCDDGCYQLKDADGKIVMQRDGYVPDFFPGDHYGDYLILKIDADGQIADWPNAINFDDFTEE